MKYLSRTAVAGALFTVSLSAAAIPMYSADLGPLNDSGVSGMATLAYHSSANTLDVTVHATGLEADSPHPMHIHGVLGGDSVSPTASNDTDGDGFVELGEAASAYGPVLVPLTDPAGGAVADFPTAPDGTIDFSFSYDLSASTTFADDFDESNLFPLANREIVIHGLTVSGDAGFGTDGEVDGTAGYKATLPVASGIITAQAVPEPSSLAMLFFGAALIGGMSITRKRRTGTDDHHA